MSDSITEIVKNYKERPNKDLILAMEKINSEFEESKKMMLNLSKHLDRLENLYLEILKEYRNRTNG